MILLIHIAIALASLASTATGCFIPSVRLYRLSMGLIAATLASGTYLVISTHSPLLSSCMSGLMYLAIAAIGQTIAYRRLHNRDIPQE